MPIQDEAKMIDERYVLTEQERARILGTFFLTLDPLTLKEFPPKEKKKIVILTEISKQFVPGTRYTEQEVNALLVSIYPDFATIRRYLVEYGFLHRTADCTQYWAGE